MDDDYMVTLSQKDEANYFKNLSIREQVVPQNF